MRTRRTPVRPRLAGYLAGVVVNGVLLALINGQPGWAAVPFLTAGFSAVTGVVDLALVTGLITGYVHLWHDPEWLVTVDGLVTTGAGLVALVRIWQVFPLDFGATPVDWAAAARVVLAVGIAGSVLALIAGLVNLVRTGLRRPAGRPRGRFLRRVKRAPG
ncbi:hypothetical protein [Amycolatopsis tolypomycina]|uniref:hypothetical protein n=1 Tax=Amycolatopsis tolypomycina TaxID=208445 RepID=UPI0033A5CC2D